MRTSREKAEVGGIACFNAPLPVRKENGQVAFVDCPIMRVHLFCCVLFAAKNYCIQSELILPAYSFFAGKIPLLKKFDLIEQRSSDRPPTRLSRLYRTLISILLSNHMR